MADGGPDLPETDDAGELADHFNRWTHDLVKSGRFGFRGGRRGPIAVKVRRGTPAGDVLSLYDLLELQGYTIRPARDPATMDAA